MSITFQDKGKVIIVLDKTCETIVFDIDKSDYIRSNLIEGGFCGINIFLNNYPSAKPSNGEIINGLVIQISDKARLWNSFEYEDKYSFGDILFELPDIDDYIESLDFNKKDSFIKLHNYCCRRFREIMTAIRPDLFSNAGPKSSKY